MEGFILAAGLGTRLHELTAMRPKALVEVDGVTLLERVLHRMEATGIAHVVVNVHHFAARVEDFVRAQDWRLQVDISDERELLLDTGGALKHAASFFSGGEPVLVHNVDILSDVDFREVERQHCAEGNLVTLCVSRRASNTGRLLRFSAEGLLTGRSAEGLAFSGIAVVSPALFPLLPEADAPYPVIDEYVRLAHEGYRIGSYMHPGTEDHWLDVGTPEALEKAQNLWKVSSDK